jgi:hypothetical protein
VRDAERGNDKNLPAVRLYILRLTALIIQSKMVDKVSAIFTLSNQIKSNGVIYHIEITANIFKTGLL